LPHYGIECLYQYRGQAGHLHAHGGDVLSLAGAHVELVRQLAQLHNQGCKVVLVSSGAMAAGRERLAFPQLPRPSRQANALSRWAAAPDALYEQLFDIYKLTVAQVLLTRTDLADRSRYLNSRNTLSALLSSASSDRQRK